MRGVMKILDWHLQAKGNLCVSTLDDVTTKVPLVNIRDVLENAAIDAGIDELLSQAQQARELLCINTEQIEAVDAIRICLASDSAATLAPFGWEMCLLYRRGDVLEWVPCGRILVNLATGSTLPRKSAQGLSIKTMHVWLQPVTRQGESLLQVYSEYEQLNDIIPPSIMKTTSDPVNAMDAVEDVRRCDWLHYAGHMNDQDFMTTEDARSSEHPFLGLVDTMPKAVFANGCKATRVLGNKQSPFERSLVYKLLYQKRVEVFVGPNDDVPDLYGGHFTIPFYESLRSGSTLGEAIRAARLAVLAKVPGLARAYIFYGDPTLRPFQSKSSPGKAEMKHVSNCFYCKKPITLFATEAQEIISGCTYNYCIKCHRTAAQERHEMLFNRLGFARLRKTLCKLSGGRVLPFNAETTYASHGFLIEWQDSPNKTLWFKFGPKEPKRSNPALIPVVAIPLDPFSKETIDSTLDQSVQSARSDGFEPIIVLAGAEALKNTVIQKINLLGITAITLPDNRLHEPQIATNSSWLAGFRQVPTMEEINTVKVEVERASLLDDGVRVSEIATRTGMQPSLVRECLRSLSRQVNS